MTDFKTEIKKKKRYETGATRDSAEGKGRYDLIAPTGLKRLALVYERGAINHPEEGGKNWQKGIPYSRLVSSALRHIGQFQDGQKNEDHLGHAIWNLIAIIHFEEKGPNNLNDL